MWLTKIEVVFDKCQLKTFLHVLFRGTHWLRHWAQLQLCNYNKEHIHQVCQELEAVTTQLFASFGWSNNVRIEF